MLQDRLELSERRACRVDRTPFASPPLMTVKRVVALAAASSSEPARRLSRGTRASTMRRPCPCYSSVSTKYRPAGLAGSGR